MKVGNKSLQIEAIENRIFTVRGQQVMLDSHLAQLYQVETKYLNRAVTRNKERFPDSFRFQLLKEEFENLKFQIGTSSNIGASLKDLGKKWFAFSKMDKTFVAILQSIKELI